MSERTVTDGKMKDIMKQWLTVIILTGLCALFCCSCRDESELVMPPGSIIEATNRQGTMRIDALDKYTRRYTWKGKSKTFRLYARSERWYGSKGAYRPTGDRDMHAVLGEGQQHFSSIEEVYPWLMAQSYNGRHEVVYTSDGLVVVWQEQRHPTVPNYSALSVDVWQIYINGEKPSSLIGATDVAIRSVQYGSGKVAVGKPAIHVASCIKGRKYYGKVLDLMEWQKISAEKVEELISKVDAKHEGNLLEYLGYHLNDTSLSFSVWVNVSGNVVFIYP